MQVTDLEGNITDWKLSRAKMITQDERPRSKFHVAARKVLSEYFPTTPVVEEAPIFIRPRNRLYLDFYIPWNTLAVEVHGQQHYEYSYHFHRTRMAFLKQLSRDREKAEWCELNGVNLVILPHYEDLDEWTTKIAECQ